METFHLKGKITRKGKLKIDLPEGLAPGEVEVTITVPTPDDLSDEDRPFTDEELKELMRPDPKTGAEIVARLKKEGGWEDKGILDGVEWVQEQRRKRRERHKW
jgi:hypothetical protein